MLWDEGEGEPMSTRGGAIGGHSMADLELNRRNPAKNRTRRTVLRHSKEKATESAAEPGDGAGSGAPRHWSRARARGDMLRRLLLIFPGGAANPRAPLAEDGTRKASLAIRVCRGAQAPGRECAPSPRRRPSSLRSPARDLPPAARHRAPRFAASRCRVPFARWREAQQLKPAARTGLLTRREAPIRSARYPRESAPRARACDPVHRARSGRRPRWCARRIANRGAASGPAEPGVPLRAASVHTEHARGESLPRKALAARAHRRCWRDSPR